MFAYDQSLSIVEADEADVVAIHRSTESLTVSPEGLSPRLCNAYVCVIQRKGVIRVYVVLEHADRKGRWVFAAPESAGEGDGHLQLLKEGLAFANSLGFTLHEVNLNYGKAMREVVIRDIPVIRRPSAVEPVSAEAPKGAAPPGAPAPSRADTKKEVTPEEKKGSAPPAEKAREVKPSPRDENEAKVLAERLAAEKAEAERESRERLALLKANIDLLVSERQAQDAALAAQEEELQGEIARLTQEKEKAEREQEKTTAPLKGTVDRLKGELESLGKGASAAAASLRDEITWLKAEKDKAGEETAREEDRLRAEVAQLTAARDKEERAAAKRIESLKAQLASLSEERARSEEQRAAKVKELEAEVELLTAEMSSSGKQAAKDIATLESLLEKQRAKKEEARKSAVERLVALAAEVEVLEAEREAVEQILSRRGDGEMAEALARAEAEVAALRREVERLAAEKALAEQSAAARLSSIQAEVTRLAPPAEPSAPSRHGRVQNVRDESVKPVPDKAEPVKPAPVKEEPVKPRHPAPAAAAAPPAVSTAGEWDDDVASAVEEALKEGEPDPFSFMGGGEDFVSFGAPGGEGSSGAGVEFNLDKALDMIECGNPSEVIEIYSSLNVVNITPAGRSPQPCGAYIVALKRGERFRVHVAWSLTVDNSTLVYSPEKQPADAAECSRVVGDALGFVETVGFMMDSVKLNADPDKRGRALSKIPVLSIKG